MLHHPATPRLGGEAAFRGETVHTARWDNSIDFTNKVNYLYIYIITGELLQRVAVIGTGCSAVQVVPKLVDKVSRLTVFQR